MFDCDFGAVLDRGPDGDGLAGNVSEQHFIYLVKTTKYCAFFAFNYSPSPVQPDPAGDRACAQAGQADLVLDFAVERLLQCNQKKKN